MLLAQTDRVITVDYPVAFKFFCIRHVMEFPSTFTTAYQNLECNGAYMPFTSGMTA